MLRHRMSLIHSARCKHWVLVWTGYELARALQRCLVTTLPKKEWKETPTSCCQAQCSPRSSEQDGNPSPTVRTPNCRWRLGTGIQAAPGAILLRAPATLPAAP